MVKVRLKGNPQTQWQIEGKMFPGRDIVNLSEVQIKRYSDIIESIEEKESVVPIMAPVVEVPKEQPAVVKTPEGFEKPEVVVVESVKKGYSKEDLLALNKAEQVLILKELGITKIPSLEKDRVEAILKAQI